MLLFSWLAAAIGRAAQTRHPCSCHCVFVKHFIYSAVPSLKKDFDKSLFRGDICCILLSLPHTPRSIILWGSGRRFRTSFMISPGLPHGRLSIGDLGTLLLKNGCILRYASQLYIRPFCVRCFCCKLLMEVVAATPAADTSCIGILQGSNGE